MTATTKKSDKITQADIDAMKKELQEYSNSKADFIRENYTEFDGYGVEYNTLRRVFEMSVNKKNSKLTQDIMMNILSTLTKKI